MLQEIQRLGHQPGLTVDSVCHMELARRYIHYFSCACAVLGWHFNDVALVPELAGTEVLIEYLHHKLGVTATPLCHARHGSVVDLAATKIDGKHLLSLSTMVVA